jgi:hypothetical protein
MSYNQNNPLSRKSSPCAKLDEKSLSEIRKQPGSSNAGKYPDVKEFCGPAGGAAKGTYPVNTDARITSAKRLAHNAPNPGGIIACADRKAKKEGMSRKPSTKPSEKPYGGNKGDEKKSVRDYEAPSRKSSSPVKHTLTQSGDTFNHTHTTANKGKGIKVTGKKTGTSRKSSSPLNNAGNIYGGWKYSRELRDMPLTKDMTSRNGRSGDSPFNHTHSKPHRHTDFESVDKEVRKENKGPKHIKKENQ